MHSPVVDATEWHREFITRFEAQRARLHEAQMMGVRGATATDQTWLFRDEFEVSFVPDPTRFGEGQFTFVDAIGLDRHGAGCDLSVG